jgi:hypothetical protein
LSRRGFGDDGCGIRAGINSNVEAAAAHPSAVAKLVVSARSTTQFAMPAPGLATVQSVKLTGARGP